MEVTAGTRDRAFFIETGALLAEKINGHAVINGDHVVEPCKIMQVIGVTNIVDRKVLVTVDRVIVPLYIHGARGRQRYRRSCRGRWGESYTRWSPDPIR